MTDSNFFNREKLIRILEATVNKTLGEVDVNNVFAKTIKKPKITGIAGDVVEQSVLGYPPDRAQRPDLDIDGELTELKTTGMRKKKDGAHAYFEAKEPASVTAVSIGTIEDEVFLSSAFWHKVQHMLFVFYEYESDKTVKASDYKDFHIRGYKFHSFDGDDLEIIKNDWQLIHDYLLYIRDNYNDEEAKAKYPNLSTLINKQTVYLDTAPKYPHPPRFRLRKRVITSIIQKTFNGDRFEKLPGHYVSYGDVLLECSSLTQCFRGLSMYQLLSYFGVSVNPTERRQKQYAEQIIVRMFGGTSKKMSRVDMFNQFGIIGKAITLTKNGGRTEDTKLLPVDFSELSTSTFFDEDLGKEREFQFEDSELFSYLNDNKFLCIIFREVPDKNGLVKLDNNIFCGFKLINLSSDEILLAARKTWEMAHQLILDDELKNEPILDKNGNQRYSPKTNIAMESPNLPKAKDNLIFFRGTGNDATDKIMVNNVKMLRQNYWIKGTHLASILDRTDFVQASNSYKNKAKRNHIIMTLEENGLI